MTDAELTTAGGAVSLVEVPTVLGVESIAVLVVAEDRIFAERCRQYLEARGHRASLAPGWWVGVHLAEAEKPDLVVVDEALANVDGSLCSRCSKPIRARPGCRLSWPYPASGRISADGPSVSALVR